MHIPTVIVVKDDELFINENYTISLTDIHGKELVWNEYYN